MMNQMSVEFTGRQLRRGAISEREYRIYRWKMNRHRQVRNRMIRLAFTLCIIFGLAFSCYTISSNAETHIEDVSFKYFTNYEVEYGDSLWSIAEEYADSHYSSNNAYIREVKQINRLSSDTIKAGDVLVIPYYSGEYK